jgi:hypothetical protein
MGDCGLKVIIKHHCFRCNNAYIQRCLYDDMHSIEALDKMNARAIGLARAFARSLSPLRFLGLLRPF